MTFEEAMLALDALVGAEVGASVGTGDSGFVATLGGVLHAREVQAADELPAVGELATSFRIGDHWGNALVFWPSRYVNAASEPTTGAVTVRTADGTAYVYPNRPWID